MTRLQWILGRFALTVGAMLCATAAYYLAYGRSDSFPSNPLTGILAAALFLLGVFGIREGGWNLVRLADDLAEPLAPRVQSLARIVAYLVMAAVAVAAIGGAWALLTAVFPRRAV